LGVTGQEAFLKVSKSIATADAPLRKTNKYLNEFATTLKNTARWQISSSLLHGFMGSVQSAYRYAQDLNESLTDIRIVTSQSAEEMATFAEKANRAAKALSTTTNQYAKASLIYYQQGLSDQEVQDRADITIKMAHASG
jgi:DNA-directed RNA polymerase specialized sigma24 family protein